MKALLLVLFLTIISTNLKAGDGLDFGIEVGLSTPNDQINNVYNRDFQPVFKSLNSVKQDTIIGNMLREGAGLGYHLGVRIKLPLNDYFKVQGSIGYHRFQDSKLEIRHPEPITAGMDFYFINTQLLDFYASGEVAFNQFSFTTDVPVTKDNTITVPIQETGNYNNFGVTFGGGMDINAFLLKLNLDVKYHVLNVLNTIEDDEFKNYLSVSIGVYF
jgi:hypothetical protein